MKNSPLPATVKSVGPYGGQDNGQTAPASAENDAIGVVPCAVPSERDSA